MPPANPPIFVTGTQRSGTTLLCRMLSSAPGVFVQNEIPDPVPIFKSGDAAAIARAIDDFVRSTQHGRGVSEMIESGEVAWWGLKDPRLTYCLDEAVQKFPGARIAVIIRDGRAVASSYRRMRWGVGCNSYSGARQWAEEVELQREFVRRHPDRAIALRYEDLVLDTEPQLRRVAEFLGVGFHPEMLTYHETPPDFWKHEANENVFKPVDPAIAEGWRKSLTPAQIRIIESAASSTLLDNGYELDGQAVPISLAERLVFEVHQRVVGEIQAQYRWRVWPWIARLHKSGG